jgi:hypothetical protein
MIARLNAMKPDPGRSGEEDSNTKITKITKNSARNARSRDEVDHVAECFCRLPNLFRPEAHFISPFLGDLGDLGV